MNRKQTKKHLIRNPEKWVGKYVRHMANWWDYAWAYDDKYVVCEWTGKLIHLEDEYGPSDEEREILGKLYNECYYYSMEGIIQMLDFAQKKQLKAA